MKRLFLGLFALAFIFSFDVRAFADEGHSHNHDGMDMSGGSGHENMDMSGGSGHENMDTSGGGGHENMDMSGGSGHENMDMSGGSGHENMDMNSESEHEHEGGHHGPVVESPPNYKILGTYGAVNLAFIMIGIWNKWFRRKGGLTNGHA